MPSMHAYMIPQDFWRAQDTIALSVLLGYILRCMDSSQLQVPMCGGHLQALMPAPDISASARPAAAWCQA